MIYFPSEKVLHTGDLFVVGAPFCDTKSGGSIKEWDQTLQKALQYDFDTVIPGHGPVSKREDLVKFVKTMATVRDRVRQACSAGADAAADVDFSGLGFQASPFQVRRAGHVQRTGAVGSWHRTQKRTVPAALRLGCPSKGSFRDTGAKSCRPTLGSASTGMNEPTRSLGRGRDVRSSGIPDTRALAHRAWRRTDLPTPP